MDDLKEGKVERHPKLRIEILKERESQKSVFVYKYYGGGCIECQLIVYTLSRMVWKRAQGKKIPLTFFVKGFTGVKGTWKGKDGRTKEKEK